MQMIKNLFSRVTAVWSLYTYVSKVNAALKSWPGTDNEIRLRAWLLDNLALLSGLATNTANPVDDAITYYTIRIIENDTAWKILFNMLTIATGLSNSLTGGDTQKLQIEPQIELPTNTTTGDMPCGGTTQPDCIRSLYEIESSLKTEGDDATADTEQVVENPLLIISAVGLILQIVQYLRNR